MLFLTNLDLNNNELQNAVIQPLPAAPDNPRFGQIYVDSSTGVLMCWNGVKWASSGVSIEKSEINGNIKVNGQELSIFRMGKASATTLGGVKVGEGLGVKEDGTLYVSIEMPTKVSDLTNDAGFIDSTVENLANYYLKSQTYSKTEVNELVSKISSTALEKVDVLPTENISPTTIYLVPKTDSSANNVYEEYIYIISEGAGQWELLGNTTIDLSNYLEKDGDASNLVVTFEKADKLVGPVSGDTLSVILGKVAKYIGSLKKVAVTGDYNDLVNKPAAPVRRVVSIEAGATELELQDTSVISHYAYDSFSNEAIIVDYDITATGIKFSISEPHSHNIDIVVTSL